MKEYILIIILFFIIIFLISRKSSTYSTSNSDANVNFFRVGSDIDPTVTSTISSTDNYLSADMININLWNDPTKSTYWGFRKVLQLGGGGAVSYLTFANDAAATAALTQQASVLQTFNYQQVLYTIPTVVIVKKSVISPCPGGSQQIAGQCAVHTIKSGYEHSCILSSTGDVFSYNNNTYGQLGNGTTSKNVLFLQVSGLSSCISMDCGKYHTCVVKSDGTVYCWGQNNYGQIGDSTNIDRYTPVLVQGITNAVKVFCGFYQTFVLRSDGSVFSCGQNNFGQLGDGTMTDRNVPTLASIFNGISVKSISGGNGHTCVITTSGQLYGFGQTNLGQFAAVNVPLTIALAGGNPANVNSMTPGLTQVSGVTNVIQVACGDFCTLILQSDGSVYATGYVGQLAYYNSSTAVGKDMQCYGPGPQLVNFSFIPGPPNYITTASQIACGGDQLWALLSNGTILQWGPVASVSGDTLLYNTPQSITTSPNGGINMISANTSWCGIANDGSTYDSVGVINNINYISCNNATSGQFYLDKYCNISSCSATLPPGKYFTPGYCRFQSCTNGLTGQYYTGPGTNQTDCPVASCANAPYGTCPSPCSIVGGLDGGPDNGLGIYWTYTTYTTGYQQKRGGGYTAIRIPTTHIYYNTCQ